METAKWYLGPRSASDGSRADLAISEGRDRLSMSEHPVIDRNTDSPSYGRIDTSGEDEAATL